MFGLGKIFKKPTDLNAATNTILNTTIYIHKVILSFAGGKIPKTYWDQDYICSFYCTLIDHFIEKLIKSSSKADNVIVIKNVICHL